MADAIQQLVVGALQRLLDEELAKEGITPELLECVDLSVAYSPVLPHAGMKFGQEVTVHPWGFPPADQVPDRFDVGGEVVDQFGLKIMRARYLLARDAHYAPAFAHLQAKIGEINATT